jgi:two-component system OmpR family response regulator
MRLLVVEDDAETAGYVIRGLREHGHVADHAKDGYNGLMLAGDGNYDVLVIDRMLPKLDGLALLKTLRAGGVKTPALFLTAIGSVEDRVRGLEVGDDYLVKPFAFAELYARIRSLSRRPPLEAPETTLCVADLEVDLLRRRVTRAGQPVALLPTEFRLLEYLLRHAGRVVTRTMLLESVWGFHFEPKTSIVETHISRLRAKIDRGFDQEIIKTVRGSGYMIDVG